MKDSGIQCSAQDVPMSGGAGATNEGKQKAFVPPPAGRAGRVPRESFRGKSCFPLAGFASRGRIIPPLRETRRPPLGASGALPPRFARHAGGGFPGFADSTTWDRSARFPELSVTQLRAGEFFVFSLYNHRAPRLRKLSPSDPRGCRAIIFHDAIPARYSK